MGLVSDCGDWSIEIPFSNTCDTQLTGPINYMQYYYDYKWHLSLVIRHRNQNRRDFKDIKFQLIIENKSSKTQSVKAYYTILVKDSDDEILGLFVSHGNISDEDHNSQEYTLQVFPNPSQYFQYGNPDPITILQRILKIRVHITFDIEEKILPKPKDKCFSNKISTDMKILLSDSKHSDVILKSCDNEEIPAHKCLLAARSSVFAAMFMHNMKENQEACIYIEDVDSVTLKAVLEFIYSGIFESTKHGNLNVLAVADKYDLQDLRDLCETEVINKLNLDNATAALVIADKHNIKKMKEKSCKFLAAFMRNNLNLSNFQKLRTENLSLFDEVLNLAMSNNILK